MRRVLAIALLGGLAAAVAAGPDRVARLVEALDSPSGAVRRAAYTELERRCELEPGLLDGVRPDSPRVRRLVDTLRASRRRLVLEIEPRNDTQPVGVGFSLRGILRNESFDYWMLPPKEPFRGLQVRVEGDRRDRPGIFPVDGAHVTVTLDTSPSELPLLRPGDELRFVIRFPPSKAPLRAGGRHRLRLDWHLDAERFPSWLFEPGSVELPGEPVWSDSRHERLMSDAWEVTLVVRSPRQIEDALLSTDEVERELALSELQARDGPELLPLLRRFEVADDVRPIAVRAFARALRPEDFGRLKRAAFGADEERETRLVAIDALGRYRGDEARRALIVLSGDTVDGIRKAAVDALVRHPHPDTIARYLFLLRQGPVLRPRGSFGTIREALEEWTGILVMEDTPAEVAGFERWWRTNRAEWQRARADLIDRARGR